MQASQASISVGGEASKQSAPQQSGAATVLTRVILLKPLKRPPSTEYAGVVKKAKQDGVASAATGAGWCSDCWARAQDACRGTHQLVDFATAQKDVAAELDQVQQRIKALTEAALSSAPVLVASVGSVNSTCWDITGGDIRITLASTAPLTTEDVEAVCKALEGLDLEYYHKGGFPHARVDIDGLESVLEKLPSYVQGQKCEAEDLQLDAKGLLTVGEDPKSRSGAKLLGRVDKKDLYDLCASTCGEGSDCQYSRLWHDGIGEGTTFENVRLAD